MQEHRSSQGNFNITSPFSILKVFDETNVLVKRKRCLWLMYCLILILSGSWLTILKCPLPICGIEQNKYYLWSLINNYKIIEILLQYSSALEETYIIENIRSFKFKGSFENNHSKHILQTRSRVR